MKNARKAVCVVVLGSLSFVLSGCGTILSGTRQHINLGSEPAGATVKVDPAGEKADFQTPAKISLEKKSNYVLRFSSPGYVDQQVEINKNLRAGYLILDIFLTGLIGVVVDAVTGGWNGLNPKEATVTLKKASAAAEGPETIDVTMRADAEEGTVQVASSQPGVRVQVEAR
jgi:hypothetical protein